MATDTKGFVLTSCKDVFFVCDRIQAAINQVIHPLRSKEILSGGGFARVANAVCASYLYPSSSAVRIVFMHERVTYTLNLHFTCDCDNKEFGPQSISLSLGAHHESARFMKLALQSLSMLGTLYFKEKDGYGTHFTVLDAEPTTFIQACANGEIPVASQFPLMDWHMMYRRGDFAATSFPAVVGLTSDEIEDVLAADYDRSRILIEDHVKRYLASQTAEASAAV
jgi:hypothetical protein